MSEAAGNLDVDVGCALGRACRVFGVSGLFSRGRGAIEAFASTRDVLVDLPTGFGKVLIFQIAPVHAELSKFNNTFVAKPVVIVISPLKSLMGD